MILIGLALTGGVWVVPLLILFLIGMSLFWILPKAYVRVPEKEVAVVYNASVKSFSRFLSAGGHWLVPGLQVIKSHISTSPQVEDASCGALTVGGITVMVDWKVTYSLDPLSAAPELRVNMARILAQNPQDLVCTHASHVIQHTLGHYTVEELCRLGMPGRLETRMGRLIKERLLPYGILVKRLILLDIVLPDRVQAAIEAAFERRLQADAEAQALAIRQRAIRAFTREDIRRQLELEQLRVMEAKQGDAVMLVETRSYHPQIKDQPPDPLQAWRLAEEASLTSTE
jgi:hypothetical protein